LWLNTLAGGRVFPGIHSHARFTVWESGIHFEVAIRSDDGVTSLSVVGDITDRLPAGSAFGSLAEASAFFQAGSLAADHRDERVWFRGLGAGLLSRRYRARCVGWQAGPRAHASASTYQ
jgi:hypothetical protein